MSDTIATCPYSGETLPGDGTPLKPSPTLAKWRSEGSATPLQYQDDHQGLIATQYELARSILEDPRFSMLPVRMPVGPTGLLENSHDLPGSLDEDGQLANQANLLLLDGAEHSKLRRIVSGSFSLKKVRARREWISGMVAEQLAELKRQGTTADIWIDYARPIAARTHCKVLGIPDSHYPTFVRLFVDSSTTQEKYDFIREVLDIRRESPDIDVITDLLSSVEISTHEIQGMLLMLMTAGRDSVAYLIATTTVALLTNPDQLEKLRLEPELLDGAIEEFMRFGAMFLTVFPRTALEDVQLHGVAIKKGQSVSVSTVAANRDPLRWEEPDDFDITRDAYGHLGFSHGIHGCIGQQLARIEIGQGISQLIQGLPGIRLIEAEQLTPMPFAHPVAVYEAGSVMVEWD